MARQRGKRTWIKAHLSDEFVRRSRREGYRARAVYKLKELDEAYGLIRPGMTVLDLGAAPGSWSQYAAGQVGPSGRVLALDILEMDPLPGVEFIRGDFREQEVLERLLTALDGARADLVLSDMAPNISGVQVADQAGSVYLAELALDLAGRGLARQGAMVVKLFHGEGFDALVASFRKRFEQLRLRKPKASRPKSREVYAIGGNFRL